MTITLASDVEEFLEEQVRAGACANAADLVNEVLRSLREQRQKTFEVTPELEAWLLQAAEQPATPVTAADFEGIRQRAKTRAAAKGT